uniref:MYB proto-oncogene like 1 n=1 Tax=Ficedula albicollis TaxID=59894 RepID=A0A803VA20_FICAL
CLYCPKHYVEVYDHDYDGLLPKTGKRHLGKTRWTREEDEKLKKLVEQNGTEDWKVIANFLPNRTDVQCQHRWQKVLNPELIKGPWTKEEDQRVISFSFCLINALLADFRCWGKTP